MGGDDELDAPMPDTRGTRGPGRPRHEDREVGREKLIERARAAMNLRPRTDIQRREIADAVGVTPALITYYFPDKWSLLEEAACPIIADHVATIEAILNAPTSMIEKFRRLVDTYITFNREHGYILDYYISSVLKREKQDSILVLAKSHENIVAFFSSGVSQGLFKDVNVELVQSMLWSVCRYLGHLPESRYDVVLSPDQRRDLAADQQSIVVDLFLNGLLQTGPGPIAEATDKDG